MATIIGQFLDANTGKGMAGLIAQLFENAKSKKPLGIPNLKGYNQYLTGPSGKIKLITDLEAGKEYILKVQGAGQIAGFVTRVKWNKPDDIINVGTHNIQLKFF